MRNEEIFYQYFYIYNEWQDFVPPVRLSCATSSKTKRLKIMKQLERRTFPSVVSRDQSIKVKVL